MERVRKIESEFNEIGSISSNENPLSRQPQHSHTMSFDEEHVATDAYPVDEEAINCGEAMRKINDFLSAGAEQGQPSLNLS